jgi:hypothetical protein
MMGLPQTAAYADDLPHIETVEELIGYLNIVLPNAREYVVLAMLKRKLRQVFGKRLSETALRCTKLSEVMELPAVHDLFYLEIPSQRGPDDRQPGPPGKTGLVIRRRVVPLSLQQERRREPSVRTTLRARRW